MDNNLHYLDNSATTKPCAAALAKYMEISGHCFGNPSSLHLLGFRAEQALKSARFQVATAMGAKSDNLYFTGSGTESDNLAMRGLLNPRLGNKIVLTDSEHPAVLETAAAMEAAGFTLAFIPTKGGELDLQTAAKLIDENTALVCTMLVNSETGAVYQVDKIADLIAKQSRAKFHIDGVQAFGKIPFSAPSLRCDTLAVSAHKIGGTKGVGALYVADHVRLSPLILGGGQERGLRSGTENVAGICAFGEAVKTELAGMREKMAAVAALRAYAADGIEALGGVLHIPKTPAPHILNFAIPGAKAEPMLHLLEEDSVYVSVGSACSSKKKLRSPVLLAMGVAPALVDCSLRVSLCFDNTKADIDALLQGLEKGKKILVR